MKSDNAAAPKAAQTPRPAKQPRDTSGNTAAFAERDKERRAAAAEDATAQAADENRLPESSAITNPAPAGAEDMTAGGAFVEKEIKQAIPVDHPAIENNPRAGTSAIQNGADFNDPHERNPLDPGFVGQGLDMSVYGKPTK